MDVRVLKTSDDTLKAILTSPDKKDSSNSKSNSSSESIKEYVIGKVVFRMKVLSFTINGRSGLYSYSYILVKFNKSDKNDDTTYYCDMEYSDRKRSFLCDDFDSDVWHIVDSVYDTLPCRLIVTVSIANMCKINSQTLRKPIRFAVLHDDNELTDFELRGEEGAVRVHSAVLATFSPALRRMLEGRWRETEDRCLRIQDVSKTTLQHFKDYLYLDNLPETGVKHLLLLASRYMIPDLENRCAYKLIDDLNAENAMELSKFALENNLIALYCAFLERVKSGAVDIAKVRELNAIDIAKVLEQIETVSITKVPGQEEAVNVAEVPVHNETGNITKTPEHNETVTNVPTLNEINTSKVPKQNETGNITEVPEHNEAVSIKKVPVQNETCHIAKVPKHDEAVNIAKVPEHNEAVNIGKVPEHNEAVNIGKVPEHNEAVNIAKVPEHNEAVNIAKVPEQCRAANTKEDCEQSGNCNKLYSRFKSFFTCSRQKVD